MFYLLLQKATLKIFDSVCKCVCARVFLNEYLAKSCCFLHADKDFTGEQRRPACWCVELRWPDTSQRVESEVGAPAQLRSLQAEEELDLLLTLLLRWRREEKDCGKTLQLFLPSSFFSELDLQMCRGIRFSCHWAAPLLIWRETRVCFHWHGSLPCLTSISNPFSTPTQGKKNHTVVFVFFPPVSFLLFANI